MVDTARDVDGSPVAWREAGPADGDLVLLLHGLGGSRTAWEPQLAALAAAGHRAVAWDMPGYGASDAVEPLTFAAIADAAVELLDVLGVGRAHLVGLSFGGQHALHVVLRHPDRVASLVLADTSAVFGADGTDRDVWIASRLAAIDAGATPADLARPVLTAIAGPGFDGTDLDAAVAAFSRIGVDGFRAAVRCLPDHDVVDRLGEITAPTLVIVGELDTETPVSYAEVLADGIAGARLVVVPDAGHLTPSESPDTFNRHLVGFLRTVTSGART